MGKCTPSQGAVSAQCCAEPCMRLTPACCHAVQEVPTTLCSRQSCCRTLGAARSGDFPCKHGFQCNTLLYCWKALNMLQPYSLYTGSPVTRHSMKIDSTASGRRILYGALPFRMLPELNSTNSGLSPANPQTARLLL